MPTPRVAATRRPNRKPPIPAAPDAGNAEAGIASKPAPLPAPGRILDPDARQMMIAEAAYYLAEKRGFVPGGELQDWIDAEAQIEACLRA
jgi:hypothetical protein